MRRRSLTSGNGGGRKGSKEVSDPLTESASYFTRVSKVANTRHPLAPFDGVVLLAHRLSSSRSPLSRRARGRERERRVYFRWDGVKVKRSHVPRAAGTPFNWDVRQNWDAVEFRTDSLLPLPLPPRRSKNGFRGSSRGGNRTDFGNDASGGSLPMCVG